MTTDMYGSERTHPIYDRPCLSFTITGTMLATIMASDSPTLQNSEDSRTARPSLTAWTTNLFFSTAASTFFNKNGRSIKRTFFYVKRGTVVFLNYLVSRRPYNKFISYALCSRCFVPFSIVQPHGVTAVTTTLLTDLSHHMCGDQLVHRRTANVRNRTPRQRVQPPRPLPRTL